LWVLLAFDAIAVALFAPNTGRSIGRRGDRVPRPPMDVFAAFLIPAISLAAACRDLWRFIPDRGP